MFWITGLIFLLFQTASAGEVRVELCPGRALVGPHDPGFTDTEKKLICGDPESPGWKEVPESQALFHA
ncbi:hypothetical protein K2X33_11650, partial [bacterium]|nr:hypothetical protein [bacterium]